MNDHKKENQLNNIKCLLNEKLSEGEVNIDNGKLFWQHTEDYINDNIPDILWDVYCENANIIMELGFDIKDAWQDNDSCGFDIIV